MEYFPKKIVKMPAQRIVPAPWTLALQKTPAYYPSEDSKQSATGTRGRRQQNTGTRSRIR
jgi:hypothetical protein